MRSCILILIICIWSPITTIGFGAVSDHGNIDKRLVALLEKGDKDFDRGFYFQSLQWYQDALQIDNDNLHAQFQTGQCYRLLFEYQKAKKYYQKVREIGFSKFPLSAFYEGLMTKYSGNYPEAIQLFDQFIQFAESHSQAESKQYIDRAIKEKEGCHFALKNAMKPHGDFSFTRLPEPINTPSNDYAAQPFSSDSFLTITSTRSTSKGDDVSNQYGESYSDLFIFTKENTTTWSNVSQEAGFISVNTRFSEGTGVFSPNKKEFIFTGCYDEGYCHLFQSTLKNGKWQKPVSLSEAINLKGFDSKQPALSASGDTLFFVSDRAGGQGMLDIWFSTKNQTGTWGDPVNLGASINTPQNDLAPFYSSGDKMLFFSSDGYQGYGSFDIFVTSCCNLSTPVVNLGPPFNSSKDDLYLSLGKEVGYLSTNRENQDGNFDIYSFNIYADQAELISLKNPANNHALKRYHEIVQLFSEKDKYYYTELPLKEKEQVERTILAQSFRKIVEEQTQMDEAMAYFYETLPLEEKNRIDRLAGVQKSFLLNESGDPILEEDFLYYKNLPKEKKRKIREIIEIRTFEKVLSQTSALDTQVDLFYEGLPDDERERIDRAVDQRQSLLSSMLKEGTMSDPEDIFFYQSLPAKQKESIKRFIMASIRQKQQGDDSELDDDLLMMYQKLPLESKESIKRLIQTKSFSTKSLGEDGSLKELFEGKKPGFDLNQLAFSNPDKINIEGYLNQGDQPAKGVTITIQGSSNHAAIVTQTDDKGFFSFEGLNYQADQTILFNQKTSFKSLTNYSLEELRVVVLEDTIIEETFDNIYFERGEYQINDSSKAILDKLASFHYVYPQVEIQIAAYADSTGGNNFNQELSRKRALEAFRYLTEKQVAPEMIKILPKGKEVPVKGKDLQYSRRVEFDIKSISTDYNPTREIFVMEAYPDLKEIAKKYQLDMQQLMDMNPGLTNPPSPFSPIRVVAKRSIK